MNDHEHEWERGVHMAEAFGIDGRRLACAICGMYRPIPAEHPIRPRRGMWAGRSLVLCQTCGQPITRGFPKPWGWRHRRMVLA